MNMLFRYLDLLNRGLAPRSPGAQQMRSTGRKAGLLASMQEDDQPRGLLGLIEASEPDPMARRSAPPEEGAPPDQLAQANPAAPPGSGASGIPPIPAHKDQYIGRSEWATFHGAMGGLRGLGPNARSAFARTFAEEGGMKPNSNGGAVAGIMPDTFDEIRRSGRIPELAGITSVGQLTPELAASIYLDIANQRLRTVGGAAALEQVDGDTSGALYDSLFQHGGAGGTGHLQDAINAIIGELPDTEARRLSVGPIPRDRKMGPGTFGAFKALIAAGPDMAGRLRRALAEERKKPRNGRPREPGELLRFDRFR